MDLVEIRFDNDATIKEYKTGIHAYEDNVIQVCCYNDLPDDVKWQLPSKCNEDGVFVNGYIKYPDINDHMLAYQLTLLKGMFGFNTYIVKDYNNYRDNWLLLEYDKERDGTSNLTEQNIKVFDISTGIENSNKFLVLRILYEEYIYLLDVLISCTINEAESRGCENIENWVLPNQWTINDGRYGFSIVRFNNDDKSTEDTDNIKSDIENFLGLEF